MYWNAVILPKETLQQQNAHTETDFSNKLKIPRRRKRKPF
jgi:hypothetical protein